MILENNRINLSGAILKDFEFSHELKGERFYQAPIQVMRTSEIADTLNIMVSDRVVPELPVAGDNVHIEGTLRSHNLPQDGRKKLIIYVHVNNIYPDDSRTTNELELNGFLCKEPIYRRTPLGREITDLMIAINRNYGKSGYTPCIAWGNNARFCSRLTVGNEIKIKGRLQSRAYKKNNEERVAYEVSISEIEVV